MEPNIFDATKELDLPGRCLFPDLHFFLPTILMSSTFSDKHGCDFWCTQLHSHVGIVSPCCTRTQDITHEDSRNRHVTKLMQLRLVFRGDGFVADLCSEPEGSVKCYTKSKSCLVCPLCLGHLVVHVAHVAVTYHRADHREGHFEPSLLLLLFAEHFFLRLRWFLNDEVCSCL